MWLPAVISSLLNPSSDSNTSVCATATSSSFQASECPLSAICALPASFRLNNQVCAGVAITNDGLFAPACASRCKSVSCEFSLVPNSCTVKYFASSWLVSELSASRLKPKSKRCVGQINNPQQLHHFTPT